MIQIAQIMQLDLSQYTLIAAMLYSLAILKFSQKIPERRLSSGGLLLNSKQF